MNKVSDKQAFTDFLNISGHVCYWYSNTNSHIRSLWYTSVILNSFDEAQVLGRWDFLTEPQNLWDYMILYVKLVQIIYLNIYFEERNKVSYARARLSHYLFVSGHVMDPNEIVEKY